MSNLATLKIKRYSGRLLVCVAFMFTFHLGGTTCLKAAPDVTALKMYNNKFAPKIRKAQGKDKILGQIATDMLKEAKRVKDKNPSYAALLCDRTYTLSARNKTRLKQAAEAANLLIEIVPDQERKSLEKLARVYLLAYKNINKKRYPGKYEAAGELLSQMFIRIGWLKCLELDEEGALRDVRRGVSIATAAQQHHLIERGKMLEKRIPDIIAFEKHVAGAKKVLKNKPDDKQANRIMALAYLVYQDDPKTALPYAKKGLAPEEAYKVQLASDPLGKVSGETYLDLAVWYMGHAIEHKSDVAHRVSMAIRARLYAEYYLSLVTAGHIKGLKTDGEIVRDRARKLATSTGLTANDFDDMTGELAMELGTMESQAYRKVMDSGKHDYGENGKQKHKPDTHKPVAKEAPEIKNTPHKEKPSRPKPAKVEKKPESKRKVSITKVEPPKFKAPSEVGGGGRSIFEF